MENVNVSQNQHNIIIDTFYALKNCTDCFSYHKLPMSTMENPEIVTERGNIQAFEPKHTHVNTIEIKHVQMKDQKKKNIYDLFQ